jgi:hypothetical protein
MPVNKIIKSDRLLASRRYTHDNIKDYQDKFTRVLDLGEEEIYTQARLIPTSSIPLFNTTGQIYSASLGGDPIMKYWSKQRLTPSTTKNAGSTEVWFFLTNFRSAGVDYTPIAADQETNFISNKYADPGLSAFNAETAGSDRAYNVIAYKNGTTTQISEEVFVFDYKTGVFEFLTNADAIGVSSVYISAYQYIGKTLKDELQNGFSGSFSGSFQGSSTGVFTGIGSGSFSGSFQGNATLNNLELTGSFNHTGSYNLTGSIDVVGPIISNGINVVDNAIAMAIALG